ncbi:DUF6090 family protein [Winogradskyella ursingii]|uniref:DUF6090 family protein n=1 Tax=Winogradskyella ursingii TaxID=2686079 RepID=UPI001C53773B|nr:DUF6090 family protein [Winogradskyella ursingii]
MLKFFRHIRQHLLSESKFSKYMLYAIGEIILVVIGILIALQINNWNDNRKNDIKERNVLINLKTDLTADMQKLDTLKIQFEKAAESKEVFESFLYYKDRINIPLSEHFKNQFIHIWGDFNPNTITIDELKNSNSANLISNPELSRALYALYDNYNDLSTKLKLGIERTQLMINYSSNYMLHVLNPSEEDIIPMLNEKYFVNQVEANYIFGRLSAIKAAREKCQFVLDLLNKELND